VVACAGRFECCGGAAERVQAKAGAADGAHSGEGRGALLVRHDEASAHAMGRLPRDCEAFGLEILPYGNSQEEGADSAATAAGLAAATASLDERLAGVASTHVITGTHKDSYPRSPAKEKTFGSHAGNQQPRCGRGENEFVGIGSSCDMAVSATNMRATCRDLHVDMLNIGSSTRPCAVVSLELLHGGRYAATCTKHGVEVWDLTTS